LGLVFEEGTGSNDTVLSVLAPLHLLNQALSQISFQPAPDYYGGGAKLEFEVSDMGGHGYGGPKKAMATQWFIIEPVNDAPSVRLPEDFGNDALFVLDDKHYVRIEGAKYRDLKQTVNSSRYWQAGFELWRFQEPYTAYGKVGTGLQSEYRGSGDLQWSLRQLKQKEYFGAGDLQWSLRQLADMSSGTADSHPHYFKNFQGSMYFVADDGHHGFELWRNDGSLEDASLRAKDSKNRDILAENERPTKGIPGVGGSTESEAAVSPHVAMLRDIFPGEKGSHPKYLEVHGNHMYFAADGIDVSWRVRPDHVDDCGSFKQSQWDARVFYAVAHENTWDPEYVYDCPVGYHWATTEEAHAIFTSHGDTMDERRDHMWYAEPYQSAEFAERHGKQDVWYTEDSLPAADARASGDFESATSVGYLKEQKSYFDQCGWEGYNWGGKRRTHFRFSDSHITGEFKHAGWPDSLRPGVDPKWAAAGVAGHTYRKGNSDYQRNSVLTTSDFAGILCIAGPHVAPCTTASCNGRAGEELWRTDGTAEGTVRVEDIYEGGVGSKPAYLTSFGSSLYFAATSASHGRELWRTTGGVGDAMQVGLHHAGKLGVYTQGLTAGSESSNPTDLTVGGVGGNILFLAAQSRNYGRELWTVTADQVPHLIDIVAGSAGSDPKGFEHDTSNGNVYFQADDGVHGAELWTSDGTLVGTRMVANIMPGQKSSYPKYITYFNAQLYFQADDGKHGVEMWHYNPTTDKARLVLDINPGSAGSDAGYFTIMQSRLSGNDFMYFTASDGTYVTGQAKAEGLGGSQIWRTNGLASGTQHAFEKTDNDVYVDKKYLDKEHPARMHVYEQGLYLPASYGVRDVVVPSGGFRTHNNVEATRGVDQAIVVDDVDTAPDGNMTVVLTVEQGLIVLEPRTDISPSSPTSLRVLLAQDTRIDRMYIQNVLESRGHSVEVVQNGEAAYNAILEGALSENPSRRFDVAFIELDLDTSGGMWDGFQVARRLRFFESGDSAEEGAGTIAPTKLVAMSRLRRVINDKQEAARAGFNRHFVLPTVGFVLPGEEGDRDELGKWPDPSLDESRSILITQQLKEREQYEVFVTNFEDFLYRHDSDVAIEVVDYGTAGELGPEVEAKLPGLTVGKEVSIEGTPLQLNLVLRNMYYYASSGSRGNVSLTVTAIDSPLQCSRDAQHIFKTSLPGARSALLGEIAKDGGTCDMTHSKSTTRTIHLAVIPSNRAPTIVVHEGMAGGTNATVDVQVSLPTVTVIDPDFALEVFKDSYGRDMLPPVSVELSVTVGRVTLRNTNGLSFRRGIGLSDKSFSFTAPLDVANKALATLAYECRSADGCMAGFTDSIRVSASDEGFSGTGGALSASETILVAVIGREHAAAEGAAAEGDEDENAAEAGDGGGDDDFGYVRPGSPQEGTDAFTVGSPGYRRN
jgi:ELWxxDGT repeat protein